MWLERPKPRQSFVRGHKRGLTERIRRGKKAKQHTRQGRCQPRSLQILESEEVEQKPKISSLSLKPPLCWKPGEAQTAQLCGRRSRFHPHYAGNARAGRLDHLDPPLGWEKKGIQMYFQKNFWLHFSKSVLKNNFLILQVLD